MIMNVRKHLKDYTSNLSYTFGVDSTKGKNSNFLNSANSKYI